MLLAVYQLARDAQLVAAFGSRRSPGGRGGGKRGEEEDARYMLTLCNSPGCSNLVA
jgi:hypothetical protein